MTDMAAVLRELAAPVRGEKIEDVIDRAAKATGMKYSRAYEYWYGRVRRPEPDETLRVEQALEKKRKEAARNEFQELKIRLAKLESRLVQTDEDFHREDIGALRATMRGRG